MDARTPNIVDMPSKIQSAETSLCVPIDCRALPDADAEQRQTKVENRETPFPPLLSCVMPCIPIPCQSAAASNRTIDRRVFQACQLALSLFFNGRQTEMTAEHAE